MFPKNLSNSLTLRSKLTIFLLSINIYSILTGVNQPNKELQVVQFAKGSPSFNLPNNRRGVIKINSHHTKNTSVKTLIMTKGKKNTTYKKTFITDVTRTQKAFSGLLRWSYLTFQSLAYFNLSIGGLFSFVTGPFWRGG